MESFARVAGGSKATLYRIERPFSNFQFIDDRYDGLSSLRRIMSQVRQNGGRTMVVEEVLQARDIAEENADIATRYGQEPRSITHRISFFSEPFAALDDLRQMSDNEFIGYAILKRDAVPNLHNCVRVHESVVRMSRHANNIARGTQRWDCEVAGHRFRVSGYLYAQQNNATNVCAHVAVRSAAARFHPQGDMSYREMNQLVGIDHINRKAGGADGSGLGAEEMVAILKAAGANCFVRDYTIPVQPDQQIPFQKYIYGSIESGFPAILGFGLASRQVYHVVPIFGHTFNEDTWVHKADTSYFRVGPGMKYIPSESWVSMYLAHDDNWGSNFCIPRRYLHVRPFCDKLSPQDKACQMESECVVYVISTVPKEVQLSPIRAEVIGAEYLFAILNQPPEAASEWRARLDHYVKLQQLVVRPILIRGADYSHHLTKLHDWDGNPIASSPTEGLRTFFENERLWMIELSVPELFSANRRKVGEVLLRAQMRPTTTRDFSNFVLARIPGYFVHCKRPDPATPEFSFTPAGVHSHVQLYACESETF